MAKAITAYEIKYAENIAKGMTKSEAYRQAGYKCDVMSDINICAKAILIESRPHVAAKIAELQRQNENASIITRSYLLEKLKHVMEAANSDIEIETIRKDSNGDYAVDDNGKYVKTTVFNEKAANALVKAIDSASRMIGANEPEKVEQKTVIEILGAAGEYAE